MSVSTITKVAPSRRRKIPKIAVLALGMVSFGGAAGASVVGEGFLADQLNGDASCLSSVAGEDADAIGFSSSTSRTTVVEGFEVEQQLVAIEVPAGVRVITQDVFRIQNNCGSSVNVVVTSRDQSGDWAEKYLEIWLGNTPEPSSYPGAVDGEYDPFPLVFAADGPGNLATGSVTIADGESVPIGMVVSAGQTATGSFSAAWIVAADVP